MTEENYKDNMETLHILPQQVYRFSFEKFMGEGNAKMAFSVMKNLHDKLITDSSKQSGEIHQNRPFSIMDIDPQDFMVDYSSIYEFMHKAVEMVVEERNYKYKDFFMSQLYSHLSVDNGQNQVKSYNPNCTFSSILIFNCQPPNDIMIASEPNFPLMQQCITTSPGIDPYGQMVPEQFYDFGNFEAIPIKPGDFLVFKSNIHKQFPPYVKVSENDNRLMLCANFQMCQVGEHFMGSYLKVKPDRKIEENLDLAIQRKPSLDSSSGAFVKKKVLTKAIHLPTQEAILTGLQIQIGNTLYMEMRHPKDEGIFKTVTAKLGDYEDHKDQSQKHWKWPVDFSKKNNDVNVHWKGKIEWNRSKYKKDQGSPSLLSAPTMDTEGFVESKKLVDGHKPRYILNIAKQELEENSFDGVDIFYHKPSTQEWQKLGHNLLMRVPNEKSEFPQEKNDEENFSTNKILIKGILEIHPKYPDKYIVCDIGGLEIESHQVHQDRGGGKWTPDERQTARNEEQGNETAVSNVFDELSIKQENETIGNKIGWIDSKSSAERDATHQFYKKLGYETD